jgi:hypothetical protein
MGQAPDEQQLSYAAARGWVLLTFNRDHFRRLDLRFREEGRPHGGIIGLPQRQPFTRLVVRAAMMLRWISDTEVQSRYFNWNDLQKELLSLCVGNRAPSFHEFGPDEVAHALGFA